MPVEAMPEMPTSCSSARCFDQRRTPDAFAAERHLPNDVGMPSEMASRNALRRNAGHCCFWGRANGDGVALASRAVDSSACCLRLLDGWVSSPAAGQSSTLALLLLPTRAVERSNRVAHPRRPLVKDLAPPRLPANVGLVVWPPMIGGLKVSCGRLTRMAGLQRQGPLDFHPQLRLPAKRERSAGEARRAAQFGVQANGRPPGDWPMVANSAQMVKWNCRELPVGSDRNWPGAGLRRSGGNLTLAGTAAELAISCLAWHRLTVPATSGYSQNAASRYFSATSIRAQRSRQALRKLSVSGCSR